MLKEQQDFKAGDVPHAVFVLQVGTAVVFCLGCGGLMCGKGVALLFATCEAAQMQTVWPV